MMKDNHADEQQSAAQVLWTLSFGEVSCVDQTTECKLLWSNIINEIQVQFNGLVQDCSNSSALVMELLQFCIKPSNYLMANSYEIPQLSMT